MPADFLSINQIAERLSVSEGTVRNEIRAGRLSAYRFRGAYRVAQEDLAEYIESCRFERAARVNKPPTPARRIEGAPFKHLDGRRSLDAWRRQGVAVDPPDAHTPPSSSSSNGPSTPKGS